MRPGIRRSGGSLCQLVAGMRSNKKPRHSVKNQFKDRSSVKHRKRSKAIRSCFQNSSMVSSGNRLPLKNWDELGQTTRFVGWLAAGKKNPTIGIVGLADI
jgi:hypothetical protein